MPPDAELVHLIEWAFLDGQIDGLKADLAYLFVWKNAQIYSNQAALARLWTRTIVGYFMGRNT